MAKITISIPDELLKKLDKYRNKGWQGSELSRSAVLQRAAREYLEKEEAAEFPSAEG